MHFLFKTLLFVVKGKKCDYFSISFIGKYNLNQQMPILTLISFLGTKGNQHFGHRPAVVEDSHIQRRQAIIADAKSHKHAKATISGFHKLL
jgi:hypothetical protein